MPAERISPNSGYVRSAAKIAGVPFTSSMIDARRADPRYYDVRRILNAGIAYFDAGQLAWDLPLRYGLVVQATYTFSKAIDQGSDFAFTGANKDLLQTRPQSQFDAFRDRKGLSNFDSPHALALSYSWELPGAGAAHSWLRHITGGWVFSGAQLLKQGTPLTLFVGSDAPGFGNVDGSGGDRPNILDPSILGLTIGDPNTATRILSRDRFTYIRPGDAAGNLGRGTFRKSPIANWNAALSHQWKLLNEAAFVFRIEAYNFTNTAQFDEPQRNLSSAAFGKITNTLNDGRALQFTMRLVR